MTRLIREVILCTLFAGLCLAQAGDCAEPPAADARMAAMPIEELHTRRRTGLLTITSRPNPDFQTFNSFAVTHGLPRGARYYSLPRRQEGARSQILAGSRRQPRKYNP